MARNENSPAPRSGRAAKPPRYQYSFISEIPTSGRDGTAVFYSRREIHPRRKRSVAVRDVKELLLLGFYLCVAAIVPARHWERICRFVAGLRIRKHRRKLFAKLESDLAAVAPRADPEEFFRQYVTSLHKRRLYYMAHVSGWHWKPRIIVEGAEEIGRAISRGKGTLIWCENLAAQTVMGKRALFASGIEAYQVNAREHGLTTTAFGLRVINPILIGLENRFLKGRLAFDASEPVHVTRRIREALSANSVVLVSANTYHGRQFVQAPVGESGYVHFATTPANFGAQGRTTLLGMSTVETIPFTEFKVAIKPYAAPERQDMKPGGSDAAIAEIVSAFRDSFEKAVLSLPVQCLGIGRDVVGQSIKERPDFRT